MASLVANVLSVVWIGSVLSQIVLIFFFLPEGLQFLTKMLGNMENLDSCEEIS